MGYNIVAAVLGGVVAGGVMAGGVVTGGAVAAAAPDTQPPTPPGQPIVGAVTCNGATLSWGESTDDVGVAFYDLYHDGQQVASVPGDVLTTHVTLAQGATWGFYVNARDAAGNVSQASATVTVTAPFCGRDRQPPTEPAGLSTTVAGTSVTLRWDAATDDVAVSGYDVYRDGVRVGSVTGDATSPTPTTFTDVALAPDTSYRYTVVARDAQGNTSGQSTATVARTAASCDGAAICSISRVTTDTDLPWGLQQLPDGTVLYTRRDAHEIMAMNPDGSDKHSVGTVPGAAGTNGEGGVLGLAIAPSFATDRWLYIYHTTEQDNRIVRMRLDDVLRPETTEVLVAGIPRNKYHNGGRLRFGPDGALYAATGDGQNPQLAQDLGSLAGKVLRLLPDGGVPGDNPFGTYVYSYGHRNPQGLAFDSRGRLWEQEFGNNLMDETNLVVSGGNYGWPDCEGTSGQCDEPGMVAPVRTYPVSQASCSGLAIVRDVVYLACLRGARLYREVIDGDSLTDVREYLVGTYGRLRTLEPTNDGGLWLTTSTGGDKDSIVDNSNEQIFKLGLG